MGRQGPELLRVAGRPRQSTLPQQDPKILASDVEVAAYGIARDACYDFCVEGRATSTETSTVHCSVLCLIPRFRPSSTCLCSVSSSIRRPDSVFHHPPHQQRCCKRHIGLFPSLAVQHASLANSRTFGHASHKFSPLPFVLPLASISWPPLTLAPGLLGAVHF
jgi:hypothetical protein